MHQQHHPQPEAYRVLINAALQHIPGDPCARPFTLGDAFSQYFHGRNLRLHHGSGSTIFDGVHMPRDVDSDLNVTRWFLFDMGVTGQIDRKVLKEVPLLVFTCDFLPREQRWVFTRQEVNNTALVKYVSGFKWGAGEKAIGQVKE